MDAQELEILRMVVKGILYDIHKNHIARSDLYSTEVFDWSDLTCFSAREYHDNDGATGVQIHLSGVNEGCSDIRKRINGRLVNMGYTAVEISIEEALCASTN